MNKLRLSPAFSVVYEEGSVLFRSDLETFRISGDNLVPLVRQVLASCCSDIEERALKAELADFPAATVDKVLDTLVSKGVIRPGDGNKTGWNGLMDYLHLWQASESSRLLAQGRLLIAGDEPWTRIATQSLFRAGVREAHFVDGENAAAAARSASTEPNISCGGSNDPIMIPDGRWDLVIGTWHRDDVKRLLRLGTECHSRGLRSLFVSVDGLICTLGPLVYPGETACWNCMRLRQLSNSVHFEHDALLAERVLSGADLQRQRQTLDPVAAIAGNFLALEVMKVLTGYTPSELAGRVLVQNMVTLETTRHTLLREPTCCVCGAKKSPSRGNTQGSDRAEHLPDSIEAVREFVKDYVDDRFGIVQHLLVAKSDATEPELPIAATAIPARSVAQHCSHKFRDLGSGKGLTPAQAMLSAFGEAIERYAATIHVGHTVRHCTAAGLGDRYFDPRQMGLYTDEQYASADFPFARYSPSLSIDWVRGEWLDSGEDVWVPALPVFFNYHADRAAQFCQVTSNGLAAGLGFNDAAFRAVCELAERDAFMVTWLCRRHVRGIDLASTISPELGELVRQFLACGVKFQSFLLESETPVATVLSLAFGDGNDWPAVTAALGAHTNAATALRKSLLELGHVTPYVRKMMRERANQLPRLPDEVQSLADHALYYSRLEQVGAVNFLSVPGQPITALAHSPEQSDLRMLASSFKERGLRIAVIDVTSPDLTPGPFRVVRAVGINMQQIHFGRGLARLGNPRLQSLLAGAPPNPDPHPLA